jgi:hypothetical protein
MKHKTERGDRGDCIDVLTNSGDGQRWPDFEEDSSDQPWGLARSPCNGADPVDLRRWERVSGVWLGVADLVVVLASSRRWWRRRSAPAACSSVQR